MFGIIKSAINYALDFILKGSIIKFVVFTALYYVVTELTDIAIGMIDQSGMNGIGPLVSGLPEDVLFFLGVFRIEIGLPMIIAAYVVRFGIRRLPIIG
ncbi:DUF2523 family protein [Novosphingobium album (ex Liu et al. 2023)]|uniref:DUF2523 family protein n=1 Tax=Novosphingobium album (ex Liu et al. 2023) TaxID=3031130 RepID=A0ABT5WPC3_9SPHN|nr:DUF2523 family protein [Novosphingobium album (ex Liu et al. 2023)]MDE8651893.1 DUF2523 family protein [Novosphingobium album (ex Liu et al. 2023)]